MSQDLTIWLSEDVAGPWAWRYGTQSGWARNDAERAELAALGADTVSVICPGQWVRMFEHDLPAMKSKDRIRAAGYAIEDQIAAPLEDQHVVIADEPVRRVGVIANDKMIGLAAAFAEAGVTPTRLAADFDVLREGDDVILFDRHVHPGPFGYALDSEFDGSAALPGAGSLQWGSSLNFLQGDFQARRALSFDRRRLARAAVLLAVAGVSWLVWQGADIRAMNAQAEALKSEMNTLYTQTTGNAAPANLAAVVNRARADGQGTGQGFLDLSAALFNGLSSADGVMVDTLRYDNARGEIVLRLIYPDFESATALENTYRDSGYEFRSGAVREQGSDLIGEAVFTVEGRS